MEQYNELVFQGKNGQPVTTSRLVAWKFGKRHDNIIQRIENLEVSEDFYDLNFKAIENQKVTHSPVVKDKEYIITRDGFVFLVMGFTGAKAAKFKEDYIAAFNKMEKRLQQSLDQITRKDLAKMLYESEEEKEKLEEQNKKLKPKAEYTEEVLESSDTYTTTQIAHELGMSAIKLNKFLHSCGVQYKVRGTWVLYSRFKNHGFIDTFTYKYLDKDGTVRTIMNTVWTEKGRKLIHDLVNGNRRNGRKRIRNN
jgi:Rha family phage regulatory protein